MNQGAKLLFGRSRNGPSTKLRWTGLTLALSLMAFVGNVIFGAVGLRGTDQYWYVGDLWMSTIMGAPVTNAIYPTATGLDTNATINSLPPRIHNLPVTYLAGLVNQAISNDYLAWVWVNFALALIIAATLYIVARQQGYSAAYIAPMFFLSFPLTLWLSINALADMSLALGSCMVILGATIVSRRVRDSGNMATLGLLIIAVGSLVMFYTRDNYLLLFPALVVFTCWTCRSHPRRWVSAFSIIAMTALLAALKHVILPQYPNAGILSTLMIGTPSNKEDMSNFYSLRNVLFSAQDFLLKNIDGLRNALLPSGPSELGTESIIVIIVALALVLFRRNDNTGVLRFWMSTFAIIYLITGAVFQNQNRYIFPLVPFASVFVAGYWDRVLHANAAPRWVVNVLISASACFLIVCVSLSFVTARAYRVDATAQVAQTTRLIDGFSREPGGSVLAVAGTSKLLPLTYAAVPRPVVSLNPRINSTAEAARLIETWDVRILVGSSDADLQYLTQAVVLAFGGRASLKAQSSYGTPGGPITLWLIDHSSTG